jgi:hypothetical protein
MPDSTSELALPYPLGADDADVPTYIQGLAERVELILLRGGEIATYDPAAGDAGKLIVVDATGAPAYRAMTGDVHIDDDGVTTVQDGSLDGDELQDNSVGGRALDDNAVAQANLQDDSAGAAEVKTTEVDVSGSNVTGTFSYQTLASLTLPLGEYLISSWIESATLAVASRAIQGKLIGGTGAATFAQNQTDPLFAAKISWATYARVTTAGTFLVQGRWDGSNPVPTNPSLIGGAVAFGVAA